MRATASAADLSHIEAIARGMEASEAERLENAAAHSPGERMRQGFAMSRLVPWTAAQIAAADAQADGQADLARLGFARGLRSPLGAAPSGR